MDAEKNCGTAAMDAERTGTCTTMTADHPLMSKFQTALKAHLLRIHDQLEREIDDFDHGIAGLETEREEIGANLYDLQREIERQKDSLDAYNHRIREKFEKRVHDEEQNRSLRSDLRSLQRQFNEAQDVYGERVSELRKIRSIEQNVAKWHDEMRAEIELSKRVVSKDKQDKQQKANAMRQMDLLLLNLESEVFKFGDKNRRLTDHIQHQKDILERLNESLADANTELDMMRADHKQLLSSWNGVVRLIENRDKVLGQTMQKLA